jgi:hypothetical protein
MSDANAVDLGFANDTLSGGKYETPPTQGSIAWSGICYTGGGITATPESAEGECISADLMRTAPVVTRIPLSASVDYEFGHNPQVLSWLPMILSTTGDASGWTGGANLNHILSSNGVEAATAGAAGENNNNYFKLTTADLTLTNLKPGQWIQVKGMATAANNGYFKVYDVDIDSPTGFDRIFVTKLLVNEAANTAGTIISSLIRNGSTRRTMTMFQEYPSLDTPFYMKAYGFRANSFTLNVEQAAKITATNEFIGTTYQYSTGTKWSTGGGNTLTAAPIRKLMTSGSANTKVYGAGDVLAAHSSATSAYSCIRTATIEISDRAREQQCIGSLQNGNTGVNSFYPSISLARYFSNPYSFLKIYDVTSNQYYPEWVDIQVEDADGRSFIFSFPYVTWVSGELPSGALDADLEITMQGNASRFAHANLSGEYFAAQVCAFDPTVAPTAV